MSFLLDTDTCSHHVRTPSGLMHRFIQHSGGLYLPTIALADANPAKLLDAITKDILADVTVLDFDSACAERFGIIRGWQLQQGIQGAVPDLMIASVALVHNLTLVTHTTADYQNIPGLRLDDWIP